jgi:hypothetical protein
VYLVVGFPGGRTEFDEKSDKIHVSPLIYWSKLSEKFKYDNSNVEQTKHLLVDYNRRKVFNSEGNRQLGLEFKTLKGISGCGIWHLRNILVREGAHTPKRLVSILIEVNGGGVNSFISTRIGVFTEILRRKAKLDLPVAKNLNLRL